MQTPKSKTQRVATIPMSDAQAWIDKLRGYIKQSFIKYHQHPQYSYTLLRSLLYIYLNISSLYWLPDFLHTEEDFHMQENLAVGQILVVGIQVVVDIQVVGGIQAVEDILVASKLLADMHLVVHIHIRVAPLEPL